MKKFEAVGCLFFWRRTDNGFLEAATGLGKCVCGEKSLINFFFMAIDRLEKRLLLHGIVFWLCHGGCRASGKCIYDKKLFVVHPFFVVIFFRNVDALWLLHCKGPLAFSFWFSVPKDSQSSNWGTEVIFKSRLCDSNPGANPCSGGFLALCWLVWLLVLCCRCPIADWQNILSLLHPSQPSDILAYRASIDASQIFQNTQVTSNKMVHKKRHHFLAQFSIPFYMVLSVLLSMFIRVLTQETT